jgi:hypothetical protein
MVGWFMAIHVLKSNRLKQVHCGLKLFSQPGRIKWSIRKLQIWLREL